MFSGIQPSSLCHSVTASAVSANIPSVRIVNVNVDGVNVNFNVSTLGNRRCNDILFPENGINLIQDFVDATAFEQACLQLSDAQRQAVRRWTVADAEHRERFSDGSLNLNRQGITGINYDLNAALAAGAVLSQEQHESCIQLSSALRQLPPVRGEYLRIAVYSNSNDMPWGKSINVGDVVTNFPCFMSVSETEKYAQDILNEQGSLEPEEGYREGIVIYKIENATTAVPLLRGPLSLTSEHEVLFSRDSCFAVTGIAIADPVTAGMPLRAGVLLTEVPATHQIIRNLYSGQQVQITAL